MSARQTAGGGLRFETMAVNISLLSSRGLQSTCVVVDGMALRGSEDAMTAFGGELDSLKVVKMFPCGLSEVVAT